MSNPGSDNPCNGRPGFIANDKRNHRPIRDDDVPPPFSLKWRVAIKSHTIECVTLQAKNKDTVTPTFKK